MKPMFKHAELFESRFPLVLWFWSFWIWKRNLEKKIAKFIWMKHILCH